jgi:hypothetical protein
VARREIWRRQPACERIRACERFRRMGCLICRDGTSINKSVSWREPLLGRPHSFFAGHFRQPVPDGSMEYSFRCSCGATIPLPSHTLSPATAISSSYAHGSETARGRHDCHRAKTRVLHAAPLAPQVRRSGVEMDFAGFFAPQSSCCLPSRCTHSQVRALFSSEFWICNAFVDR